MLPGGGRAADVLYQQFQPLFMLVAVAVGMFNNPASAYSLPAPTTYPTSSWDLSSVITPGAKGRGFNRACAGVVEIRPKQDAAGSEGGKPPRRQDHGDAVRNAVTNLLNIGDLLFFLRLLSSCCSTGFINTLAGILGIFLLPLGFSLKSCPPWAAVLR